MAKINEKVLREGLLMIETLLWKYATQIDDSYCKMDGGLDVKLVMKLTPSEGGNVEINNFIDFKPEPNVKDKLTRLVDPEQMELFNGDPS